MAPSDTHPSSLREPVRIVAARAGMDGAGVRLARSLGSPALPMVDPFLMLDEFRSDDPNDYIAGFPSHPHRGFETVTIMLAGNMEHRDSNGNTGNLRAGSVQWMTAGRGIIHSEMPKQVDGLMWGFQLWVNLPAKDKLTEPRYQDIPPEDIPEATPAEGVRVRVLAGKTHGATGPVDPGFTAPVLLDIHLDAGRELVEPLPAGHNAFVYPYEGAIFVGLADGSLSEPIERSHAVVLGEGDAVRVAAPQSGARLLVVAGRPIEEPVARYGPFVMNTRAELERAFEDYRAGRLA